VGLVKWCDFNLRNLVHLVPGKHTFEVRILPGHDRAGPVVASARLFEAILGLAVGPGSLDPGLLQPGPEGLGQLLAALPADVGEMWVAPTGGPA
jgi:hypothetical protein